MYIHELYTANLRPHCLNFINAAFSKFLVRESALHAIDNDVVLPLQHMQLDEYPVLASWRRGIIQDAEETMEALRTEIKGDVSLLNRGVHIEC